MAALATVLYISDLHFVKELTEEGRRMFGIGTTNFVNSHSFGKLRALETTVKGLKLEGRAPDLVVATGDISTDGSPGALKTALEFIEKDRIYHKGKGTSRYICRGLDTERARRLVIPGNHDRYRGRFWPIQRPSQKLEAVFGIAPEYPYTIGYRRPGVANNPNNPALIFFVFDSTPTDLNRFKWNEFSYKTARGRLTEGDRRFLVDERRRIKEEKWIAGFDGTNLSVEYDNSVRIAVLHHHPVALPSDNLVDKLGWTLLEDSDRFIEACFDANLDFVWFGHQHKQANVPIMPSWREGWNPPDNWHNIFCFCCPSTSEFSSKNGFYLFDFDLDRFRVEFYEFKEKAFEKRFATPLTYPARRLTIPSTAGM